MAEAIKFGALCWNQYADWPAFREAAVTADRLGYDDLWTWDHLYPIVGSPERMKELTGPFRRAVPPLVLAGSRLYLQRYYAYERAVAAAITAPPNNSAGNTNGGGGGAGTGSGGSGGGGTGETISGAWVCLSRP